MRFLHAYLQSQKLAMVCVFSRVYPFQVLSLKENMSCALLSLLPFFSLSLFLISTGSSVSLLRPSRSSSMDFC